MTEVASLEKKLSYKFKDKELLKAALTHRSFHDESKGKSKNHNERLEFLGDAVVDLAVSDLLMALYPQEAEGPLSKKRASLVNEKTLADLAKKMGIGQALLLGKGERKGEGEEKPRLLASAFEAVVGAIYLDGGFRTAKKWLSVMMKDVFVNLDKEADHYSLDFKTRLQELIQAKYKTAPTYELSKEKGPSHSPTFEVNLKIGNRVIAKGSGRSKKQAEQEAAKIAFEGKLYE
ncbi:MAG: ribonuclease III [Pseudobdellovibrionaceae bacterium]